jgi:hypothetical protein
MIDIGTRKHGPFDPRSPRPRIRAYGPNGSSATERATLDAWQGEGGLVSPLPVGARGRPARLPDGLSWAEFFALAFPGRKRHYFPAIAVWYRYRDGGRSWPQTLRPGTTGRASAPRTLPQIGRPRAGAVVAKERMA